MGAARSVAHGQLMLQNDKIKHIDECKKRTQKTKPLFKKIQGECAKESKKQNLCLIFDISKHLLLCFPDETPRNRLLLLGCYLKVLIVTFWLWRKFFL